MNVLDNCWKGFNGFLYHKFLNLSWSLLTGTTIFPCPSLVWKKVLNPGRSGITTELLDTLYSGSVAFLNVWLICCLDFLSFHALNSRVNRLAGNLVILKFIWASYSSTSTRWLVFVMPWITKLSWNSSSDILRRNVNNSFSRYVYPQWFHDFHLVFPPFRNLHLAPRALTSWPALTEKNDGERNKAQRSPYSF